LVSKTLPVADYLRLEENDRDPFGNMDRIMRFENLGEDFRAVCQKLGISSSPLPAYNRSTRDDYAQYYDDELRELVEQRFAAEIEHFGYRFE
jgi:hypothetical protein